MLYDVNVSILVDAEKYEEAEEKVQSFLSGNINLDCNFMVHNSEPADFDSLAELRKSASKKGGKIRNKLWKILKNDGWNI